METLTSLRKSHTVQAGIDAQAPFLSCQILWTQPSFPQYNLHGLFLFVQMCDYWRCSSINRIPYICKMYKSGQSHTVATKATSVSNKSQFYIFSIIPTVCNQPSLLGWHIALIVLGVLFLVVGGGVGILIIILLIPSVTDKFKCELCQQYFTAGLFCWTVISQMTYIASESVNIGTLEVEFCRK